MANQKPVDEIRIGRVKATVWKNGTEDQRGTTSPSRVFTKTAINGKARRASGATICWCLRKWPIRPTRGSSSFPKSRRPRPSPSGHTLIRARRSHSLRRARSFPSQRFPIWAGRFTATFRLVADALPLYLIYPSNSSGVRVAIGRLPSLAGGLAGGGAARVIPSSLRVCLCRLSWVSDKDQTVNFRRRKHTMTNSTFHCETNWRTITS